MVHGAARAKQLTTCLGSPGFVVKTSEGNVEEPRSPATNNASAPGNKVTGAFDWRLVANPFCQGGHTVYCTVSRAQCASLLCTYLQKTVCKLLTGDARPRFFESHYALLEQVRRARSDDGRL